MAGCNDFSEDLTAWIDGELPPSRRDHIRRHLAGCRHCSAEMESLHSVIAWHRHALGALTTAAGVDTMALRTRLRHAMAAEVDAGTLEWRWRDVWTSMWARLALAGAAVSVAVAVLLLAGGPGMVLIPLGLEAPPPAVVQHTELFKDYPMIERLDVLEHFDTVESLPLDDEGAAQRG
jgi:anti-sigma factor RsiW